MPTDSPASLTTQSTLRVVLYEGADAQPLEAIERFNALTALLEKGFAVTRAVAGGRVAPHPRGSLLVLGKFAEGRAREAKDISAETPVRFQDITGLDAARIAETAEGVRAGTGAVIHGDWKPWALAADAAIGLLAFGMSLYIVYLLEIVKLANPYIRRREQEAQDQKTA